ncbi:integration host factor subunit alpha [Paraburkholderia aspalathi]|uniref:Integration host factor subunit alpha n=1 Tax=Paraburkholderia aspalathi TaxID=1324617 RepID=A0A1I7EJC2_9BURK|nr:integration host factor subunit alpha [Paraburkholderia aspalathi]SFU24007.1 integration host factor subunit alpha [Paraburkholderia aspalathi]
MREIPTSHGSALTGEPAVTKNELAQLVHDRVGFSAREAKELVEAFFEVMCGALESGENVRLSGFGKFQLRDKRQRPGRNPKTGEMVLVAARRIVTFSASQRLRGRP